VRFKAEVDFTQDFLGQSLVADHDNGVEVMARGAQKTGLFGIKF
jgi:hypothetical protein